MGARGPRAAPTILKLMRGESRPSRVNRDEPELPPPTSPEPPKELTGEGVVEWRRLIGMLTQTGVLTDADLGAFEDYCLALTELRRYERQAAEVGAELAIAKGYAGLTVKLRAQVAQLRSHLGLTPSSRSGVKAAKKPQSATEAFRQRATGA